MKYGLPRINTRSGSLPDGDEVFFIAGVERLTEALRRGAPLSPHAHQVAHRLISRVEALKAALEMREEQGGGDDG